MRDILALLAHLMATLADLPRRGIDVIARLNVKRKVDFRKAKRLGPHDGLFVWTKSHLCPPYLTSAQWAEISAVLTVRIVRFRVANGGSRTRSITLVTTLLDPKLYPLEELAILYAWRWRLELCFRDLKTQMGMEQLRCLTRMALSLASCVFWVCFSNSDYGEGFPQKACVGD
jgi:IS4 transposase